MAEYGVSIDRGAGGTTTIEAHDIEEAWQKAKAWLKAGTWDDDGRALLSVRGPDRDCVIAWVRFQKTI